MIWILSWSGPEAGLAITKEMHVYLQKEYNAIDDMDYPDYVLYNKPLKWFGVTWVENRELVERDFIEAMQSLENMGASVIRIACNTLHTFCDKLSLELQSKVVHMVHETCKATIEYENILVLCSATTTKSKLYESYLKNSLGKKNILTLEWKNQETIDDVIESVMWGNNWPKEVDAITHLIKSYEDNWRVGAVILWCTELPLAYTQSDSHLPIISSNQILAKWLIEKSKHSSGTQQRSLYKSIRSFH